MFIDKIQRNTEWTAPADMSLADWRHRIGEGVPGGSITAERSGAGLQADVLDWLPVVDSSGHLLGHVRVDEVPAVPSSERLEHMRMGDLARPGRITLRPDDLLTDACHLFHRAEAAHLSLVDAEGVYLGEVFQEDVRDRLLLDLGVTGSGRHALLLAEAADAGERPLSDLMRMAEAESLPLCGLMRLSSAETVPPSARSGAEMDDAGWDGSEPAVDRAPILLLSETPFTVSFLSTVRRSGYFLLSEHPDLETRQELSDKADAFLHFLDI